MLLQIAFRPKLFLQRREKPNRYSLKIRQKRDLCRSHITPNSCIFAFRQQIYKLNGLISRHLPLSKN